LRINSLVKEWQYNGLKDMEKQYLRSDESTSIIRILIALLALPLSEWFAATLSSTNLIPSPKCT
jgi:hypothetical protein